MEQHPVTENSDIENSVCEEASPIEKIEYTKDVLLSYQLTSADKENIAKSLEEVAAKYPRVVHYGLSKLTPRRFNPLRNQLPQKPSAPEVVGSVAENTNSKNDNDKSMLRLKEGVLNQTRILQLKLEQMKLKAAAATADAPE